MSENQEEASAPARQEIERLQQENSQLRDEVLELRDELLRYTGLPGQMHRIESRLSNSNHCWSGLPMRWRRAPPKRPCS
jgi:hypothetical protein